MKCFEQISLQKQSAYQVRADARLRKAPNTRNPKNTFDKATKNYIIFTENVQILLTFLILPKMG